MTERPDISIFLNEEKCIEFLVSMKIIKERKNCWKCKRPLTLNLKKRHYVCYKKTCGKTYSIFKKTFFENCKADIHTIFYFCFLYLCKMPVEGLKLATGLSSATIVEWSEFVRQVTAEDLEEVHTIIGGEGIEVEVDETKLGKRKYHKGHRVEGVWVIAGIEKTDNKKCFLVTVEKRDEETIRNVLSKYVAAGSIIHTDGWKAYKTPCAELFTKHLVVNHSKTFKDTTTGACTNTVEGLNNGIKHLIRPRNRNKNSIKNFLSYFIWRRLYKKRIWDQFLMALKKIKYE